MTAGPLSASGRADEPIPLPMAGERRERADAAVNRARILCAARRLLRDQGLDALTLQGVATAAGVGKGTVSHRFGGRDGLTDALLDDYMREFQDRFLHGPPPLGPGAPAPERLEAFMAELVRHQAEHLPLALAAERTGAQAAPPVYGALLLHARTLIAEADPGIDAEVLAAFLMGAVAPPVLHRLVRGDGVDVGELEASARRLARGVVGTG